MSSDRRCVLVVGGSHSVHVLVPARMLREAGYRVVLADLQEEAQAGAREVFHAIYPVTCGIQRLVCRHSAAGGVSLTAGGEDSAEVRIEAPIRTVSYAWRLMQGRLRSGLLLEVVRREQPGVIHFQSMTAGGMTAYYTLKRMGWPPPDRRPGLLTHLWGYAPRYPGVRKREIQVLREFDHIHTSSPAVARIYRENYEVPDGKISVFVRGINLGTFAPREKAVLDAARAEWGIPSDKFVIIHNRHLHPMYKVEIAVEAFIRLAAEGRDVVLMLVRGSMCQADYEGELLARLKSAGFEDRVAIMPPVLTADQMAVALQLSHCCVNCVPFDAFPVSILEAMYCRSVPVVRDLESYTQFVKDGRTAFAVNGSPEVYAGRIRQLMDDPGLRARMADAGMELVSSEGSEEIFRRNTLGLVEKCWHEW